MKRMFSLFTHIAPLALIGVLAAVPAVAQTTPPPAMAAPTPLPDQQGGRQPGQQGGQGQQPGQGPQATTPPAAAPRPEGPFRAPSLSGPNNMGMPSHTNIRLDLTITDTFTGTTVKKNVTLLILQNSGGMIRTTSFDGWATLNVDAVAAAYTSGLVSIRLTFEYTPPIPKDMTMGNRPPKLNESITVVLQDGKPMMVSQSADPATDRRVTTELTATILK